MLARVGKGGEVSQQGDAGRGRHREASIDEAPYESDFRPRRKLPPPFKRLPCYRERGIKVLSLFFVDRVDNFVPEDGKLRLLYVKCFNEAKQRFPEWRDTDPMRVEAHYFASRNRRGGAVEFVDTSGRSREDE